MTHRESTVSDDFAWPEGKRAAVSLTFDDARPTQLDRGVPILDRHGVKATFYVGFGGFEQRIDDWRNAVAHGHEIGNHSMTHPCSGNFPGAQGNALEDYSLEKMERELLDAGARIREAIGVEPVTFAYPCGQSFVGRGGGRKSYVPLVARHFLVGRGYRDEFVNDPSFCDLAMVGGTEGDGLSSDRLRALVETAASRSAWVVLCGHDVGDGGYQTTLADSLDRFCAYCRDPANGIWIDTVAKIGQYARDARGH